jgi:hypothetical protein
LLPLAQENLWRPIFEDRSILDWGDVHNGRLRVRDRESSLTWPMPNRLLCLEMFTVLIDSQYDQAKRRSTVGPELTDDSGTLAVSAAAFAGVYS